MSDDIPIQLQQAGQTHVPLTKKISEFPLPRSAKHFSVSFSSFLSSVRNFRESCHKQIVMSFFPGRD